MGNIEALSFDIQRSLLSHGDLERFASGTFNRRETLAKPEGRATESHLSELGLGFGSKSLAWSSLLC